MSSIRLKKDCSRGKAGTVVDVPFMDANKLVAEGIGERMPHLLNTPAQKAPSPGTTTAAINAEIVEAKRKQQRAEAKADAAEARCQELQAQIDDLTAKNKELSATVQTQNELLAEAAKANPKK